MSADHCDHDWRRSDLMGCSVCPRCHGVRWDEAPLAEAPTEAAGGARNGVQAPSPLDLALARDPWSRIDGRHKR